VLSEVCLCLGSEAFEVRAGCGAWQDDLDPLAEGVFEIRVDGVAGRLLDESDEATDSEPDELEHGECDVHPPLVTGHRFQEHRLLRRSIWTRRPSAARSFRAANQDAGHLRPSVLMAAKAPARPTRFRCIACVGIA
jgi:hypothetical protein